MPHRITESEFERRISLVQSSIVGLFISSSKASPVSFYQILNRSFLMTQTPICIALYKYEESSPSISSQKRSKSYAYCDIEFIVEKQHKKEYLKVLERYHGKERNNGKFRISTRGKFVNSLIPIYSTGYSFLVFKIGKREKDGITVSTFDLVKKSTEDSLINNDNYIFESLHRIFDNRSKNESGMFNGIPGKENTIFNKDVRKSIDNFNLDRNDSDKLLANHDSKRQEIIELEEKYLNHLTNENGGIFSSIYQRLEDSPASILKAFIEENGFYDIPNITFYNRYYNLDKVRHKSNNLESFSYDVKIIIPEPQKRNIKGYFDSLTNFSSNNDSKFLIRELINKYKSRGGELYYAQVDINHTRRGFMKSLEHKFWSILLDKNKGSGEILRILESKTGKNFRSFTDAVFSSGIVHYRSPFDMGGIDRIIGSHKYANINEVNESDLDDYLRIVSIHYLFNAMAPFSGNSGKRMLLALFPLEVSGKIMTVVGHVVYMSNKNTYLGVNEWNSMYYFYHYIALRIERRLRKGTRRLYIEKIFRNFEKLLTNLIQDKCNNNSFNTITIEDFQAACLEANEYVKITSRYMPFNIVEFNISESAQEGDISLMNVIYISLSQTRNPYFPALIEAKKRNKAYPTNTLYDFNEKDLYHAFHKFVRRIEDKIVLFSEQLKSQNNGFKN